MSYTVEATYTKPADKQWFGQVHPALGRKFKKLDRYRATGLTNRTVNNVDENTVVITSVWESEADYQAFVAKRGASIADAVRAEYGSANGITVTTRVV